MALHHLHIRKRHSKSLEPYPALSFWKRLLDKVIYAVGVAGPLMAIPQIFVIYSTKSAVGVSAFTWGSLALLNMPWILYGLVHKEMPIVITHSLWLVFNSIIFIGVLMYR